MTGIDRWYRECDAERIKQKKSIGLWGANCAWYKLCDARKQQGK